MKSLTITEAHTTPSSVADEWRLLEGICHASGYQTYRWVEPWLRVVGRSLEPLIILARDPSGAPAALIPLTISREGRVVIASYAGGKDSNINMPLVRPDVQMDAAALRRMLVEGARAAGVDVFALYNQPVEWVGRPHPMGALPGQPSPSFLHSTLLPSSGEAFFNSLSSDARKRTRWRLRKLAEIGDVSFIHAHTPEDVMRVADSFREQKKIRIKEMGADDFDVDLAADFLETAALAGEPGAELHALMTGDRVAAMYGGVVHQGRYSAMVNSYDTSADIARTSPGELVSIYLLQSLCDRGVTEFDLGVGEAAYKERWCDRKDALFDTLFGVTSKGKAYAFSEKMKLRAKRQVKQSRWLWPLAKKLRAALPSRSA